MASADSHKTGFLDLSVELRNQIYGYVLQEDKPIKIELIRRRNGPLEIARSGVQRNKHHRRQVYDRSKKAWVPAELKYAAIIYVNKQVCLEASDVLYAVNCFKFATTTTLRDMIPILGRRAHLLRYVEIETTGYRIQTAPAAFKALIIANNLKKIHISHFDVCTARTRSHPAKPTSIAGLVQHCEILLKALENSYRVQGKAFDMSQLISIELPGCTAHSNYYNGPFGNDGHFRRFQIFRSCGCVCRDAEAKNQELRGLIQTEIRNILRKDEDGKYIESKPKAKRRSDRNKKD